MQNAQNAKLYERKWELGSWGKLQLTTSYRHSCRPESSRATHRCTHGMAQQPADTFRAMACAVQIVAPDTYAG